jgi:Ca2+-transporting ATPase
VLRPIHASLKGRTRYRVKGLYRSHPFKTHLESQLRSKEGITRVSASTLTGNLLVAYNSDRSPSDISGLIQRIVADYTRKAVKLRKSEHNSVAREDIASPASKRGGNGRQKQAVMSKGKLRRLVVGSEDQSVEPWHVKEADFVLKALANSSAAGLSDREAKERLKKYGPNVLPEAVPRSGLSIFLDQLKSLPVGMLTAAASISVLTGGVVDAVAIMAVVGMNAVIGYVTESQSEKTIFSLKSLVRPRALVRRDEKVKEIGAGEIVPGDVLVLRPGQYVAADARLIEAKRLSIDESALTGESIPAVKKPGVLSEENVPLSDRSNMCYMGTLITGGQGLAVVIATAKFTEMGSIQAMVGEAKTPQTPMEMQLDRVGIQLVVVSGVLCGIVFVIGLFRGYGLLQMLKTGICLAVAAIPEGLPTVATTTLALGIREMRRHKILIRHLDAVEALGSVQVICLDKTGTITLNRMSVVEIYVGTERIEVSKENFVRLSGPVGPIFREEVSGLVVSSALCNESEVIQTNGGYVINGSPTENALVYMALGSGLDVVNLKEDFPLVKIIHRSERRNIMVTVHKTAYGKMLVTVKGSPTEILSLCTWQMRFGEAVPFTDEHRLVIQRENERMAGSALRVLGVAYALVDCDENVVDDEEVLAKDLIWLGLVGMADPIREGVKELMAQFHKAGIKTVMITGDQSPTAYAIGKELNLNGEEQLRILDSTSLSCIDSEAMQALCQQAHVFARVSPGHKLQIVQGLQGAGKVVAMTGDGINDSPALKAANIGVAMGETGTDVAREVADVVLENDNIETMMVAVSQGRTIYDNVRKSLHFLLATNLSEIMVTLTANIGGMGQPLTGMQLLWINLISDIFPGLALSLEAPADDVLDRPPRDSHEPIVTPSDLKKITREAGVISLGAMGSYSYGIARYGIGLRASSMAFLSLTVGQLLHAISCRSDKHSIFDSKPLPSNKYLNVALGGSFALQALALLVPGLRSLIGIGPMGIMDSLVVGTTAVLPLAVNEMTKKVQGKKR